MTKNFSFPSLMNSLLLGVAVLLPIFFLPFTNDIYDSNKRFLFLAASLVALIIGGVHVILKKEVRFTRTPWTAPVIFFGLATLATVVLISPNKVMALLGSGGLYLSFVVLFLTATSIVKKNFTSGLINVLSVAGVIVTLTSLLDRFGVRVLGVLNQTFDLTIPKGTPFFITGSPLFSVFLLGIVITMLLVRFLQHKGKSQGITSLVIAGICVIGVLVNGEALLPGRTTHPQFLSLLDSWSIATDVLKTPLNAALGVGTDSYASAFSIFKPVRLNQSPLWFVRFNNGRNIFLELLTTQGVVGMIAWLVLTIVTLRLMKTAQGDQLALGVGTLAILGIFLFFPPNVLLVGLLCVFLIAWSASLKERNIRTTETVLSLFAYADLMQSPALSRAMKGQSLLAQFFGIIVILVTVVGFYGLGRAYAAEYYFNRSLVAAAKGNGKDTYDLAVRAVVTNPFMENYHRAFAVTNLSLAQAISQNKNASDQDKQNVLTLIQQGIQQAKIATTLDPLDTANWDTLTNVYQSLIGAADGAPQWTIASYVEQIKTDPSNPQVRFNLASAYRLMGNDDMALKLFEQAAQLKPDYANAYFNMADIYRKKGDKQNEFAMLQATLSLIKPDQEGYQSVKDRFEALQKEGFAVAQQQNAQATPAPTPRPTPTPRATPSPSPKSSVQKVTLPSDAGLNQTGTVPEVPKQ